MRHLQATRRRGPIEPPVICPVLGFGVAGWIGVGIFLLIAGLQLAGADLQLQVQRLIATAFGADVCDRVTGEMVARWIACAMPGFAPLGILYVFVFLHLAARRVRAWEVAIVILWWLAEPSVRWYVWWNMQSWYVPNDALGAHMAVILREGQPESGLITAVVLWLVTRSFGVLVTVAFWSIASLPLTFAWAGVLRPTPISSAVPMTFWWHIPIILAMAVWAMRSRLRALHAAVKCISCGYDLRGISGDVCPECGFARVGAAQNPARSTARAPSN